MEVVVDIDERKFDEFKEILGKLDTRIVNFLEDRDLIHQGYTIIYKKRIKS
jgi:hypothetical protein